jgi:tRNA(Arg) A34 adenosine deaminase TadA
MQHTFENKNDTKPNGKKVSAKGHVDYILRENAKAHAEYITAREIKERLRV